MKEEKAEGAQNLEARPQRSRPAKAQHLTSTKEHSSASCLHLEGQPTAPKHLNASITKSQRQSK